MSRKFEAEFHDSRIDEDDSDRVSQSKYYWCVEYWQRKFDRRVMQLAAGRDVLELGCFDGSVTERLASVARHVTAIDISPRAVEVTCARAEQQNIRNVDARLCDAESLSLPDCCVDLVVGTGVIHHVDVAVSIREVARVLRSGGLMAFREPLAHNPIINLYRAATPRARTPDEHPLTIQDLRLIRSEFPELETEFFGFFTLAAAPLRRRYGGREVRDFFNALDRLVFNNRFLGRFAWQANIYGRKRS